MPDRSGVTGGFFERVFKTGDGDGFVARWPQTGLSSDAALSDFDGDGDVDAFVTNISGHHNRVWLNCNLDEECPPTT